MTVRPYVLPMPLLPYARLLRIPNVFTAFADVLLGTLAAGLLLSQPFSAALLLVSSGCLYCAGMVWNDYFDFQEDKRDRPFRPLPSGQISRSRAAWMGAALLVLGIIAGSAAPLLRTGENVGFTWTPAVVTLLLTTAILAYDGGLKRTPIGPVAMGACRFLNLILATSLVTVESFTWAARIHLAAVIGIYIAGVTLFARSEVHRSRATQLILAAILMATALALGLALPIHYEPGTGSWIFPYALAGLAIIVGGPVLAAIRKPDPQPVQAAVKRCILGLILLDATLATAFWDWRGLAIGLLLLPALLLGRAVYST